MSQTGYTPIQLYRSSTAAAAPSAGSLADGELALNTTDEKLYFKNASGVVKVLASSAGAFGTVTSVDASGGTTGLTFTGGPITSSGTLTLGGTLAVANGGTGATSLTSGYLVKGNGTSAVSASVVYDNGTNVGIGTSSPASRLHLYSTTNTSLTIQSNGGTATADFINNAGTQRIMGGLGGTNNLGFYTASTERMRIDSSGNVGIGTSSPSGKLDVSNGGTTALFGADSGADTRTDATSKLARIGVPHYTNAEEPVAMLVPVAGASTNQLQIGGGSGTLNAMNLIQFYTAANNTTVTGSERMRIDSSGNVGIGTSSPGVKLDVSGSGEIGIRYTDTVATNSARLNLTCGTATGVLQQYGSSHATFANVLRLDSYAGPLQFATTNVERMRIDSSGNVGIGTTSPAARLSVAGRADFGISTDALVYLTNAANAVRGVLDVGTSDFTIGASGGGVPLILLTSGSERMRIDSSGNVGIGTSSPSYKLDVVGSGSVYVRARSTDTVGATIGYVGAEFAGGSALQMRAGSGYTYLVSTGASDPLLFGTNTTERVRIDSSGNVGIGTSSPSVRLDIRGGDLQVSRAAAGVAGDAAINFGNSAANYIYSGNSSNIMAFATNGSERMRINSSGNVGIGTTSPDAKLDILGTTSDQLRLRTAETEEYRIGRNSSTGYLDFYGSQTGYTGYVFGGVDGERLRIDSSGNVGIGTAAPLSLLHISGDSNPVVLNQNTSGSTAAFTALGVTEGASFGVDATGAYITSSASAVFSTNYTERMRITSSGNVGIGTTSPGQKLTVAGTVESTSGGFKFPDGTTQTTGVLEQVDVYTTIGSTTWTKPSWAKSVQVILIGGGGGGGSGRKGAAGTLRTGGAGGGGGAFSVLTLRASYLGSTVTVTVGGGGAGGASQTVNSTNGNAGTNGGTSSFGTILYAPGGSGGGGGSASGGTPGAFARGTFAGGQGGVSSLGGGSGSGITATSVGFNGGAYGGAGGGSVTAGNANTGGGQGVNTASSTAPGWKVGGFQATPASNSVSGAGSSGSDNDSDTWLGGESGSGGGSSISGNAFNGGDGGNWGGGGGGGGGAVDSVGDSGAGGTGGDGIVVVISRG